MAVVSFGRIAKGLHVKYSNHKDVKAITPGMRAIAQAAVEQQQLKNMGQQQQTASQINQ